MVDGGGGVQAVGEDGDRLQSWGWALRACCIHCPFLGPPSAAQEPPTPLDS